ncbi:MAG TPA: SpoVG family protein [Candidatus Fimivicinus intestinavium]|nr:SpoVG family protein [Candidatus Fimivicinus intestinavium]
MEISEVKIRRIYHQDERLCAMASLVIDNALAVHEVKVINGPNRKFIAMPSRKEKDGSYRDLVHPLNRAAREEIERAVFAAYEDALREEEQAAQLAAGQPMPQEETQAEPGES